MPARSGGSAAKRAPGGVGQPVAGPISVGGGMIHDCVKESTGQARLVTAVSFSVTRIANGMNRE